MNGRGDEVALLPQRVLLPAMPVQDRLSVLDHLGMSTEICGRVMRVQRPLIRVFPNEIVNPAGLTGPRGILPGTADCRDVSEPGYRASKRVDLLAVCEFRRAACALNQ